LNQRKDSVYEDYIKKTHAGVGDSKFSLSIIFKNFVGYIRAFLKLIVLLGAILLFFFIINGGPLVLISQWFNIEKDQKVEKFDLEDTNKDGVVTPGEYQEYHQDYWERYR
jgi:hypothetical protein